MTGKEAITLAIAYGNWLKAAQIAKVALGKRKRFYPSELRCDSRYVYRRSSALSQPITQCISQQPIAQQLQPRLPQLMTIPKSEETTFKGHHNMKIICPACGAQCHMNKSGNLRAHRNDQDRTKLCTGL